MEPTTACAACGAPVSSEEVAQGLAVKVSGRLLCPLCLDRLPGDAQVAVNQMRALRGMAVTTYRYYSGRHPQLPLYTFTTAALLLAHRRRLVHGEPFDTPPLPPPGSRPRLPTASEAARGDRTGWMAVAGISVLVITGVVWLLLPAAPPPPPPPVEAPAVQPAPPAADPPAPTPPRIDAGPAGRLTLLEERLRRHPEQARAVADEAELLRDGLPPGATALRNRADTLAAEALAVHAARQPPAPAPTPPEPIVPAVPEPPVPAPIVVPPPPAPVDAAPPPAQAATVPDPAPTPTQSATPAPVAQPAPPQPPAAPTPPRTAKATGGDGPSRTDVVVEWPATAKPLLGPDGLPQRQDVPWPWPSGEAIHAGAMDGRGGQRRLAIEVRLAGTSPAGGATIVVHPGKAERRSLLASWTDGSAATEPVAVPLDGLRWQAVAIAAAGSEVLAADRLRLRLEDARDLGDQRPFLIAGASVRWDAPPQPDDHPLRLPLLMPPGFDAANGWVRYRDEMARISRNLVRQRSFSFARAKVLLPLSQPSGGRFGTHLRGELAALLGVDKVPNGTLDALPDAAPEFADPQAGWPADGMGDLDERPVAVLGWRAQAWGADEDLEKRLLAVLNKLLTAGTRPRRPACMPVLVIGDVDRATPAEREAIDRRWEALAGRIAARGVPVIDLRPAQAERDTDAVQRAAALMLADALRQLDWVRLRK